MRKSRSGRREKQRESYGPTVSVFHNSSNDQSRNLGKRFGNQNGERRKSKRISKVEAKLVEEMQTQYLQSIFLLTLEVERLSKIVEHVEGQKQALMNSKMTDFHGRSNFEHEFQANKLREEIIELKLRLQGFEKRRDLQSNNQKQVQHLTVRVGEL